MSGPGEHLETELKFDAGPGYVLPDLTGLLPGLTVTAPVAHELSASYFDTADRRLAAAKITLRRRTGGHDEGWHLKLPVDASTRREIREPLSPGEQVPVALASMVARHTGGAPLIVTAHLQTRRTIRNLMQAGEISAELADDTVSGWLPQAPGGPVRATATATSPARWREIEVELVTGPPAILDAAGPALIAAGASRSAWPSKLARLLAAGTAEGTGQNAAQIQPG